MPEDDKIYFQDRAEAEIALAQHAEHPDAVRSHYLLAAYYLDLVHNETSESDKNPN
jgi:hypothetical protein